MLIRPGAPFVGGVSSAFVGVNMLYNPRSRAGLVAWTEGLGNGQWCVLWRPLRADCVCVRVLMWLLRACRRSCVGSTYSSYFWNRRWVISYEYHYLAFTGAVAATGLNDFRVASNTLGYSWSWGSNCQPAVRSRWPVSTVAAPQVVLGGLNHMWPWGTLYSSNRPIGFWLGAPTTAGCGPARWAVGLGP